MDHTQELRREAQQIVDRAKAEHREFTADEEARLDEIITEVNLADGEARKRRGEELDRLTRNGGGGSGNGHRPPRGLGDLVINSEQYQSLTRSWPKGLPERGQVGQVLAGVPFAGIRALLAMQSGFKRQRLDTSGITEGGAIIGLPEAGGEGGIGSGLDIFVPIEYWGGLESVPYVIPPLMLRRLITVGTTTADLILYPQLLGVNNRAAFVQPGELKPESDLEFTSKTAAVGTIAHMLTVTRQALADVAALRTYLDRFLLTGLDEVLERAVLMGSPPDMQGIINTPGILDQPFETDILQTARLAILKLQMEPGLYTQPTAFLLSPEDSAAIDLMRDSTGRYYGAGPFAMGPNLLWGLPRVISYLLPAGVGYVADWRYAVLWDREQGTISASDSHKDYFQRNLVAILAELRAGMGILRPGAFCKFETQSGGTGNGGAEPARQPSTEPARTVGTPPTAPAVETRRPTGR